MAKLHLTYPANIAEVTVQRRRFHVLGAGLYHLPFLVLYCFAFEVCRPQPLNPKPYTQTRQTRPT